MTKNNARLFTQNEIIKPSAKANTLFAVILKLRTLSSPFAGFEVVTKASNKPSVKLTAVFMSL